ncbi:MAG: class II fumarate hydratase [Peptoniphilaceae bacterium]|nr:class II fumarate hydratase [Peptoniphilaceae bacterium]
MKQRVEHDSMGEVLVPEMRSWGAQTQRSLENFPIGQEKMPRQILEAFALLKKAAALANRDFGKLSEEKCEAINRVCREIIQGELWEEFPLSVWQTGSGTQSNMNINEVIAHRAGQWGQRLHPNDDVNCSQSSNDTFPTAMYIAAVRAVRERVLPALVSLADTFEKHAENYRDLIKIGRTHLQDATPITFGQEISGWASLLRHEEQMLKMMTPQLEELAIGGTAVGTGLNAPPKFGERVCAYLRQETGYSFHSANNKFQALSGKNAILAVHGILHSLAADLLKIANDLRWLASGPRAGLGEIVLPENEPGSSIMPGKVNPTQCEALAMVCIQVMGNQTAIGFAASQGNFELNVYMPVIAYNFLQSAELLSDAMTSFRIRCVEGMHPDSEKMQENVERSLMLVTALSPHIGYEKAADLAQYAHKNRTTLRHAVEKLGYLSLEEFDAWTDPQSMV